MSLSALFFLLLPKEGDVGNKGSQVPHIASNIVHEDRVNGAIIRGRLREITPFLIVLRPFRRSYEGLLLLLLLLLLPPRFALPIAGCCNLSVSDKGGRTDLGSDGAFPQIHSTGRAE